MPVVIFVKKSDLNIDFQTTVRISNSDIIANIYKYTDDGCEKYFSVPKNINYIGYIDIDKDQFYIINIKNDVFTEDFKNSLGFINKSFVDKLQHFGTKLIKEEILLIENKIMYLHNFPSNCEPHVNLDKANAILSSLNAKLECVNYQIRLNYVFEMKPNTEIIYYSESDYDSMNIHNLLLCLFDTNAKCVSSLTIKYNAIRKYLTIYSMTNQKYEGMKINKLLRSVIIIIAKSLYPDIDYVYSSAMHPASAYLMINYFNAQPVDYRNYNPIVIDKGKDKIKEYFENFESLDTRVLINEENIQKADNVFQNILDAPLKCAPVEVVGKSSSTRGKRKSRSKSKSNSKSKHKRPKNI